MSSNAIKLPRNIKKDIETLIDYVWEDELISWVEEGRPKNHLFEILVRLCDNFGFYYDPQDFDSTETEFLEKKKKR